jgi:anthranilate synthase component 2
MSAGIRILMVDNHDSFTFNLLDEFARRGCRVEVWRNSVEAGELMRKAMAPPRAALIVLSPGPGRPSDAGCCIPLVRMAAGRVPLLGVCLGHQAIVEAFSGEVAAAESIVHGRASMVSHDGDALFAGVPSPFPAGRYHSLAATLMPENLMVIARAESIPMAARHRRHPLLGLQFHPESILTPDGGRVIENVLAEAVAWVPS